MNGKIKFRRGELPISTKPCATFLDILIDPPMKKEDWPPVKGLPKDIAKKAEQAVIGSVKEYHKRIEI